jgi:hypothetical protein
MKYGKIGKVLLSLYYSFNKKETKELIFIRVHEKFDVVERPFFGRSSIGPRL